ncbi:MAG: DsbA family protein [Gemmatimonadota bacterium]
MIIVAGALLALSGEAALLAQQQPPQPDDASARAADASRHKGAEDAPVVVYEIGDFQCPYCARFSREVFPQLDSAYIRTGRVRWVYINFPVPSHRLAWVAAEAALCAGVVGDRFWAMHDRLYEAQDEWSGAEDPAAHFARYAREIDLPVERHEACMRRDDVAPTLIQDLMSAASAQIRGTPTFIIDGERSIVGVHGFDEWQRLLDEALDGNN